MVRNRTGKKDTVRLLKTMTAMLRNTESKQEFNPVVQQIPMSSFSKIHI